MTFIPLYVQNLINLNRFHTKVSKFNFFEYLECYIRHYFPLAFIHLIDKMITSLKHRVRRE